MPVETPASLRRGWPRAGGPRLVDTGAARARERLGRSEAAAASRWWRARDDGELGTVARRARGSLARRLDRLNAPVVYPWSPSLHGEGEVHRLHRAAAELLRRRARGVIGGAWLAIKAVLWPFLATAAMPPLLWRCGPIVRDRHGLSLVRQARDLCEAVWTHGIFPTEYYHRRVFTTAALADKSRYLSERELLALVSAADRGSDSARIDDPRAFLAECGVRGTPAPRTFALVEDGRVAFLGDSGATAFPHRDLFVRPCTWREGEDGETLRWQAGARAWSFRGERVGPEALAARLGARCGERSHLVQECLRNHPELARFSEGGLCTVRIATGAAPDGAPEVLFASLAIPGCAPADRPDAGVALVAGIDPGSGVLTAARGAFVTDGEFESHPGNGAVIAGRVVPHWPALRELALATHAHHPRVPFVGWELALTAAGPVLLEASTNWGHFDHVLPAETAFARICLRHLDRQHQEADRRENLDTAGRALREAA